MIWYACETLVFLSKKNTGDHTILIDRFKQRCFKNLSPIYYLSGFYGSQEILKFGRAHIKLNFSRRGIPGTAE